MGLDRSRGVTGLCESYPRRFGGVAGTKDAAVAGTEDATVHGMPHCRRRHQTVILPSPASPHVWSESSQQAHSGGTGCFERFIPRGTVQAPRH